MTKILINRNRIAVQKFERQLNEEQAYYSEAIQILKGTGLLIDDPELLTKLALHYVKRIDLDITVEKKLAMTEHQDDYYRCQSLLKSLSFDFDVYTTDGKQIYIEDNYFQYADTEEEIKTVKELISIANKMEALQLDKNVIRTALDQWNFDWNPYNEEEILIQKHHLLAGIQWSKEIKASNESHAKQKKAREAKQVA